MNSKEFRQLLQKYIEGKCTSQEKIEVTEWLDASPDNMKEYLTLRKLNDITIWQCELDTSSKTKRKFGVIKRSLYVEFLKIAAVFFMAIFVSYSFFNRAKREKESPVVAMQKLSVPPGQRAELILADGTKVWLNAKSTLHFPSQFSGQTREVKLDGEGFFEVTKNESKPFIVNTQKFDIKVLGTIFNLRAYSENSSFSTSLLEGSIEILQKEQKNGLFLTPNEQAYLENDHLRVVPIRDKNDFQWRNGIINFDDEPFSELIQKLELYYDLKIEIENNRVVNYRCTGKFRIKDGVDHILKVLQLSNKFNYNWNKEGTSIIIK